MIKYYAALFLITVVILYNVYSHDPCIKRLRTEFSSKYPDYRILEVVGQGSPEEVQCHIQYTKPGNQQTYKDVWVYQNTGNGWEFSKILASEELEPGT